MAVVLMPRSDGPTVWVITVDPSLLESPLNADSVERQMAKQKIKHFGRVHDKATEYVMIFDDVMVPTNALNKSRTFFKHLGAPGAAKSCTNPDVVHLVEWGYDLILKHQGDYDFVDWFTSAPESNIFYTKRSNGISAERRAHLLKLLCPSHDVLECAWWYRVIHRVNSFGTDPKSLQDSFGDAYRLISNRWHCEVSRVLSGSHEGTCLRCSTKCSRPNYCSQMCASEVCLTCKGHFTLYPGKTMRTELYQPNIDRNIRIGVLEEKLSLRPLVDDERALAAFRRSFCCRYALNGFISGSSCDRCCDKRIQLGEVDQMQRVKPSWGDVSGELKRLLTQPDVEPPPPPPIRVCESCSMEAHDESPFKRARHA